MKNLLSIFTIFCFLSSHSLAEEIPTIIISAGKTYQSESTVGSDVSVMGKKDFADTNNAFLGETLDKGLTGINYFQSGGNGTVSGVQLRGLPKRYSTVYIDGVKMSDPSTPSNDYYFNHIMTSSIGRVEVLKGAQTSLYGSGAISGTVNIFSKKGREGHHKNVDLSTGMNNTKNLNVSFDGKQDNYDYYIGLTQYSTDGMSAMNENDEDDGYRNDGITANAGYNINDKFRVESYLRYADSFLQYDEPTTGRADTNTSDDEEASLSLRLIRDDGNLKNTLSYNKTYFLRNDVGYAGAKSGYKGIRDTFNLLGQYNLNYDTKIVYGLDNEFESAEMDTSYTADYTQNDEAIYSQYVDLQFRPSEKIYSTIGFRRDDHTIAGGHETARATMAFLPNKTTKFRSSLGTGIRFGSLDEYHYEESITVKGKESLMPEESVSFDIGVDKLFTNLNLDLNATLFYSEYDNHMLNWKINTDGGRTTYAYDNTDAKVTTQGMEISSKWKPQDDLNLTLGYTMTDTYDGATCDNPNYADFITSQSKCNDDQNVRVPNHAVTAALNKKFKNNINTTLIGRYVGERRDFGNGNNGFTDVILREYYTLDLAGHYNILDNYKVYFSLVNILDNGYEEAFQYSSQERTFNVGFKRTY